LVGARAEEERARLAYSSNIEGVNTTVARLRAELSDAQWDLEQTVTRSPTAGFVTQVALRPGMYVVPAPLRPQWFSSTPTSGPKSSGRLFSKTLCSG
jgi:multidrug resistance efflux pump